MHLASIDLISHHTSKSYVFYVSSSHSLRLCSFYFSKLPEFVDTFIMLLKRNYHQVSFLHVYHHSSIFLIWWLVTFLAPTGEAWYSAMLNSFIHVIMYGYYFAAAIGFRGVDFVKRYITMMQMTQFVTMMIQVGSRTL